ncbi:hypothetical protein [Algicola sagamiensis]|uniref:hypothetical protein n=1 Tax=Algicola sagamiensis TaxID=163869 RepID=UPI000373AF75|nr:hypothetical protein [Algicola sagamiensis]
MNLTLALMGLAVYTLIWKKMPEWRWFAAILEQLPRSLRSLYDFLRCPFCSGFWIALSLHALTGLQTVPALAEMSVTLGSFGLVLGWFLDALTTALIIYTGQLGLEAISGPAIKGYEMTEAFKQKMMVEVASTDAQPSAQETSTT